MCTLLGALFFAVVLTYRKKWADIMRKEAWGDVLLATVLIAIVYYGLSFAAAQYTSAGNLSIVALMEVCFSFLILGFILRKEKFVPLHLVGAIAMIIGVLVVLSPDITSWNKGDFMMLIATMFPPIGNMGAKRARSIISSEAVMFLRSMASGLFFAIVIPLYEPLPSLQSLLSIVWPLLINGIVLIGFSKLLWMEGLHRVPIPKAITLASLTPVFTLIYAYFFLHEPVHIAQLVGLVPMVVGVHLLTKE